MALNKPSCLAFVLVCVGLLVCLSWPTYAADDLSHGFGDSIEWVSYRDALAQAKELNKPIFLLLHKSWCGACKRLKVDFAASKEIAEESKKFVMVNAEDEEEPHNDATFNVDGGYIPRLFFLTPEGQLTDIYNEAGNASYKYYYFTPDQILAAMSRALSAVSRAALAEL